MVPQQVQYYVDRLDTGGMIYKHDAKKLMFGGFICVPGHNHDLSESNISVYTINLTKLGKVELMGAPNCTFYHKTDPDKPAYLITSWNQDELEYFWTEF